MALGEEAPVIGVGDDAQKSRVSAEETSRPMRA